MCGTKKDINTRHISEAFSIDLSDKPNGDPHFGPHADWCPHGVGVQSVASPHTVAKTHAHTHTHTINTEK